MPPPRPGRVTRGTRHDSAELVGFTPIPAGYQHRTDTQPNKDTTMPPKMSDNAARLLTRTLPQLRPRADATPAETIETVNELLGLALETGNELLIEAAMAKAAELCRGATSAPAAPAPLEPESLDARIRAKVIQAARATAPRSQVDAALDAVKRASPGQQFADAWRDLQHAETMARAEQDGLDPDAEQAQHHQRQRDAWKAKPSSSTSPAQVDPSDPDAAHAAMVRRQQKAGGR